MATQAAGEWNRCGSNVSSFVGTRVALVGKVVSCDEASATIEAHDGANVTVTRQGPAYTTGFVQVIGIAQESGAVKEETSTEMGDDFDLTNYASVAEFSAGKFKALF